MGQSWGGTDALVRSQGESFAKSIWYHKRWAGGEVISINWSGMTTAEEVDNQTWCENFKAISEARVAEAREVQRLNPNWMEEEEEKMEEKLKQKKNECRGGCGEKNAKLLCSRCKTTGQFNEFIPRQLFLIKAVAYCTPVCQREDWKVSPMRFNSV